MNLCDSCKKWEGCGTPKFADGNSVVECARFTPITRADLAARDAEIGSLKTAIARFLHARDATELIAAVDCVSAETGLDCSTFRSIIAEGAKP